MDLVALSKNKLSKKQLASLRPLEKELRIAVRSASPERAIEIAMEIQALFAENRHHHRLLRAKLWAFESCLDANRLTYAEQGFTGIRGLAKSTTRLYLEASSLLAICNLRQRKVTEAKELIREVVQRINNIKSNRTRQLFQRRLIERIEEECILTELVGSGQEQLDVEEVQAKAILLVQRSSDAEIFKLIGNSIPTASIALLSNVRDYSIKQLPPEDRKMLPPGEKSEKPKEVGKATFSVLRRIAWKTFCNPDSSIYKLWKDRVPKVFNEGYFSAAVVSTLGNFNIGIPLLASGIVALVMKYSAEEFCKLSEPKGLMIDRTEK